MRRGLLAALVAAGCSAPTYSRPPDLPAYPPREAPRPPNDPAPARTRVEEEERSLHRRIPPAVALLHDSVERIVSQLGEQCTPENPGGDGLHWRISCATETLFGLGAFEPREPALLERWRQVGQTLAQLQLQAAADARSLRVAVSGFADHVRFAANHPCPDLAQFWNATLPPGTDDRGRNAALSFCRAARMAREIACATLPAGHCTTAALAARPALTFGVFGGSTSILDREPARFHTSVLTAAGLARCGCDRLAPDAYGPPIPAGEALPACPTEPGHLFECDDARRVELDIWLDVDAHGAASPCAARAAEPNAQALLCYQDGYHALSHQSALPRPSTTVTRDTCATPNPFGWIEGHPRTDGRPCAAEVGAGR